MLGLGVRLIFSLAVVLGLLLLIARFANRRFSTRNGAPIQVVHRQQLSRASSVTVVTVGTRVLVLGSTEQQVTLLTELEPDEIGLDPDTMRPEIDPLAPSVPQPKADWPRSESSSSLSALSGSILSPATWRQLLAQFRRTSAAGSPSDGPSPFPTPETREDTHVR